MSSEVHIDSALPMPGLLQHLVCYKPREVQSMPFDDLAFIFDPTRIVLAD